jgi:hypothetical protein
MGYVGSIKYFLAQHYLLSGFSEHGSFDDQS